MDLLTLAPEFDQHALVVEPYLAESGSGEPLYGPAFTIRGWCEGKRRMVRTQMTQTNTGDETMAEATFYANRGPTIPPGSRVTLPNGLTSRVLQVLDHDGGSLPLPSHLEIVIA